MMVTFCQRVINGAIFEAKCRNLNQRWRTVTNLKQTYL
jgi:hypothetical protein